MNIIEMDHHNMPAQPISTFDLALPFQLEHSAIRGRLVRLDDAMWQIIRQHNYPEVVNDYLGQATALAIVIANCFKFEGLFTLQINGDGPLRLLVIDTNSKGHLRACARFDTESLSALQADEQKKIHKIFGRAQMFFTIDPDKGDDRYQGIVELTGATLAECTNHFFRQSEQLETGIVVASGRDSQGLAAASLMIQRLPLPANISIEEREQQDDQWIHALSVTGSVSKKELLDRKLNNMDLLYRLFWEEGVRVYEGKPYIAQCRCSQEKLKEFLNTFSEDDRQHMFLDEHITVTCEFCNQSYDYDEADFD